MTVSPKRQQVLDAATRDLRKWSAPEIVETVGPYEPGVFSRYESKRQAVIDDLGTVLENYTDAQVEILADAELEDREDIRGSWLSARHRKIRPVNSPPPWYAGGFGHPDHTADFEHWARNARLSVHETVCLSVGIEPESFTPSDFSEWEKKQKEKTKLWSSLTFLLRRRDQIRRQFDPQGYGWKVDVIQFVKWAERVNLPLPPEFVRLIRRYHEGDLQKQPVKQGADADKREIDTIAQLFTAMAIDCLGYNPKQSKGPIPREISEIAASMGMTISPETIRKYLRIGAEFIAPDWKRD